MFDSATCFSSFVHIWPRYTLALCLLLLKIAQWCRSLVNIVLTLALQFLHLSNTSTIALNSCTVALWDLILKRDLQRSTSFKNAKQGTKYSKVVLWWKATWKSELTEICVTWWHWLEASTLISLKVVGKILIYVMHPVFVLFWDFNNRNRFGKWKWTQKSIIGTFRPASHYYRFIHKKYVNLSK